MVQYNYNPLGYAPCGFDYGYGQFVYPQNGFPPETADLTGSTGRQQDLGIEWHEQEGGWKGVWRRRGDSHIFDARWTMRGAQNITAVLTINRFGNNVQVLRRNSSDGNNCDYTGTIAADGRTVTGTYTCTQGGGSWRATITF